MLSSSRSGEEAGEVAEPSGKVEALVGEIVGDDFRGKRLRFTGVELDRKVQEDITLVLYQCGEDKYRILVARVRGDSTIVSEPEIQPYTGEASYGFLSAQEAAAGWPNRELFAEHFPVQDID
jgi:hypothetical protein